MAKVTRQQAFSDVDAKALAAERLRRQALGTNLLNLKLAEFTAQNRFIQDPAHFKLALCTRRSGKTTAAAIDLVETSVNVPGSVNLFFGRTRMSAKNVIWRMLRRIIEKANLTVEINKTELSISFPNGSLIFLAGVDATTDERDKYLGMALQKVYIDECASHRQDLTELCLGIIMPALVDHGGTLCLIGTPGNFTKGLFFRLSSGKPDPEDPLCSVHRWTAFENPAKVLHEGKMKRVCDLWADEIERIKIETPLRVLTPLYKQHYEGLWVVDDKRKCYHYLDSRNGFRRLPPGRTWKYVLGIDLGFTDDSAFVVLAFSLTDPKVYVVEAYKKAGMDITACARRVKYYVETYTVDGAPPICVVDGAAKQSVAEMMNRHDLELITADKTDKANFIALLDDEMLQAKVVFEEEEALQLIDEMEGLIWGEPKPGQVIRKENPGCPNHACDAFLYAWRYTYTFLSRTPAAAVLPGTPAWAAKEAKLLEDHAKVQYAKNESKQSTDDWLAGTTSAPGGLDDPMPTGWETY